MPAPNISISISTFLACLTTAAHALLLVAHEKKKKIETTLIYTVRSP